MDRIVEIGILKIMPDGKRYRFRQLIRPGIGIPVDAYKVHGISDSDVAHKPSFKVVAKKTVKMIRGCDLAGYNISHFDLPMLCAEFERAGVEFSYEDVHVIDVKDIYHHHAPRRLCDAVEFYCNSIHDNGAHYALEDARATWRVLQAQVNRHGLPRSVSKLADWLEQNSRAQATKYAD